MLFILNSKLKIYEYFILILYEIRVFFTYLISIEPPDWPAILCYRSMDENDIFPSIFLLEMQPPPYIA